MNAHTILAVLAIGSFAAALISESYWSRAMAAGLLFLTLSMVV